MEGNAILTNEGFCPICEAKAQFTANHEWLRDYYLCQTCGTCPRQRALVTVLNNILPNWKGLSIHESSPCIDYYERHCFGYSKSFFYQDVPLGQYHVSGNRCENLECLTFDDESFDIFITQDVMEHVFNPDLVVKEVMRVLTFGGLYIFTAPKHKNIIYSYPRSLLREGQIINLREPMFHDDPIDPDGCLVTWDYGADFEDLLKRWGGYLVSTHVIRDRRLGIDGEFLEVFYIFKLPENS
jgi:SAM-dependent methyltransferase